MTGFESILPIVIIGIFIIVIIGIIFILTRSKKRLSLKKKADSDTSLYPSRHPLDYHPEIKTMPVIKPTGQGMSQSRTAAIPRPDTIDLINSRKDMTDSLVALVSKYSLKNFTIATADGLIFGSSGGVTAQSDAAIYSETFRNDPLSITPGVATFGLTHKGSDLVGIVRFAAPLSDKIMHQIAKDTKDILNQWV